MALKHKFFIVEIYDIDGKSKVKCEVTLDRDERYEKKHLELYCLWRQGVKTHFVKSVIIDSKIFPATEEALNLISDKRHILVLTTEAGNTPRLAVILGKLDKIKQ